jgi:hypothetical protein
MCFSVFLYTEHLVNSLRFLYSQYIGCIYKKCGYINAVYRLYIQSTLDIKEVLKINGLWYVFYFICTFGKK